MTGMQQLDQPAGSTEYVPRHAWVEPGEAPGTTTTAEPELIMYGGAAVAPTVDEPYQLVDTSGDYVPITPERKRHRWGRKGA